MLDFRNVNTLWASVVAETLQRLGLTSAVVCPGSRSTPLAVALAQHPEIEAIAILDERSAAFFALGIAKRAEIPPVLVCTSGTAGANFYPAVIEAKESNVPLLILTADRPSELRHCHAGQTIDQLKLYGTYPNWQTELATPAADLAMLRYLRQTLVQAWERSLYPLSGPVHLNLPFRDPLAPVPDQSQLTSLPKNFFSFLTPSPFPLPPSPFPSIRGRGIIIAGVAHSHRPQEYCGAIARLSTQLHYPVLAEALSPVRNWADLNPYLVSTYDLILRNPQLAHKLAPEVVIQVGELPTSKDLRAWLGRHQPQRWIIDPRPDNFDPLHGRSIHLRTSVEQVTVSAGNDSDDLDYLKAWCVAEKRARQILDEAMKTASFEGKVAWLLSQHLPTDTPLFIANSMSVRHAEFFWQPGNRGIIPYFNRGANGIDGTLSTALGIAHGQQSVMLTGDLALLHDTNGFLMRDRFKGHLTIVLINNNGGGIFEMLPISQFEPPFEEYFATPQQIDFGRLCATYGVEHQRIESWEQLQQLLNPLPATGIRVLEVFTDRKADAGWLQHNLKRLAEAIGEDGADKTLQKEGDEINKVKSLVKG
ncbi:MAG: 2-succinyl-5-enolpyruvyl-6-hydroxy-3-cyclohexene-1-carboxylic-acid synthase [Cyanophyceae cyanobacterium]